MRRFRSEDKRPRSWEDRLKDSARGVVSVMLRRGKLTRQPCEECGDPKAEAHHDDYSKPLDVRWLCRDDHGAWHDAKGPGLIPSEALREFKRRNQ
jgi:hypothetical protein